MDYIKRIRSRASKVPKKIILSEGTDDRVILAAIESVVEGLGVMTLIGPVNFISEKIKKFTSTFQQKKQNEILSKIDKNVVIKLPMTKDGIKATSYLSKKKIPVNVTLIFSASQALIAAKAGAAYVSPFVGRLDDISSNGMNLISDLSEIFLNYGFHTEILVASIRNPIHIIESAKLGADVATLPYSVLIQLFNHPLTDIGIEKFLKDWNNK